MVDKYAKAQADRLAAIRAITKPSHVRLYHEPAWLKKLIRQRLRMAGTRVPPGANVWVLCRAMGVDPHFLDHWGTVENGRVFVSEPYLSTQDMKHAIVFSELLGLNLDIDAASEWNPPSTIRLSFSIPKEQEIRRG